MIAAETGRALSNIDSEAALCGALLRDNARVDAVADGLVPEDFSEPFLADIYAVIVREAALGRPASPITLRPYLIDHPSLAEAGGITYLNRLAASDAASWSNPVALARQIRALSARRALVNGLDAASALAADPAETNAAVIDRAEAALSAATATHAAAAELPAARCIQAMLADMDGPRRGVLCGRIAALDVLMGPMRPKQLNIGAARPGMGKTALALSYSLGAALNAHGVLYVSLEMSAGELAMRLAADLCFDERGDGAPVPFEAIRDGTLTTAQKLAVARAADRIADAPFVVADHGSVTIGRLNMIVRRYQRRMAAAGHRLELVVIDYLQLVQPDGKGQSNYEAVSEVSRGLKAIAKDHDVAVFALAQLSRAVEQREDKRPQLSDLRDSGQIEQDADAVLFLYRHEYYLRQAEPEPGDARHAAWRDTLFACEGMLDMILAKRRNGRTGRAQARFHGANQAVRG